MTQPWHATNDSLQIDAMPFYWRLSSSPAPAEGIAPQLPIEVTADERFDYLKFTPTSAQWDTLDAAYRQNENIGFLNPESGQMETYGRSVNAFFLSAIQRARPARIYEVGCGAGYSIRFLRENGFDVTGIDPSEYSLHWSERLGFKLINDFFKEGLLDRKPDFIYCNDVFEHIPDVARFSRLICESLDDDGVFCIATTNSTRSIALGDISMFEHQHVNMFTERSIRLILADAGFNDVDVGAGAYGNTFHVVARKSRRLPVAKLQEGLSDCLGYFERATRKIEAFGRYYSEGPVPHCYVPLRCIPYLATVGDFGTSPLYDTNAAWRGKFIDGYGLPILSLDDVAYKDMDRFFVGSITFYEEIHRSLVALGWPDHSIMSAETLT